MPNHPHSLSPSGPAHRRIDYQRELNPAQHGAVTTSDGPVLVIARAGNGKTRSLVYRLAYLVDQGVDPGAILLLTFTRKSAQEMLTRAAHLLNRPLTQVMGGTFHSVCYHWLRHYGGLLGYPEGFTVMDRSDQGHLLAMVKENLGLKGLPAPFPRKETLADILSATVNKNLSLTVFSYWTRDGQRVVFRGTEKDRPSRAYILEPPGGPPQPIAPEGIWCRPGDHGRALCCYPREEKGRRVRTCELRSLDGRETRQAPWIGESETAIAWDPDGRHAFVRSSFLAPPFKVFRVDMATGRREPWLDASPPDLTGVEPGVAEPGALTPDVRYYAYAYGRRLSDLFLVEGLR